MRQYLVLLTTYCMSLAFVVRLCCIPFLGERPPAILRDVVALRVYFLRQPGRRGDRC